MFFPYLFVRGAFCLISTLHFFKCKIKLQTTHIFFQQNARKKNEKCEREYSNANFISYFALVCNFFNNVHICTLITHSFFYCNYRVFFCVHSSGVAIAAVATFQTILPLLNCSFSSDWTKIYNEKKLCFFLYFFFTRITSLTIHIFQWWWFSSLCWFRTLMLKQWITL